MNCYDLFLFLAFVVCVSIIWYQIGKKNTLKNKNNTKQKYFLVTASSTYENTTFRFTFRYNAEDGTIQQSRISEYVCSEIKKTFPFSNNKNYSLDMIFEMTYEQYNDYTK